MAALKKAPGGKETWQPEALVFVSNGTPAKTSKVILLKIHWDKAFTAEDKLPSEQRVRPCRT